jgi:hypothetical protein
LLVIYKKEDNFATKRFACLYFVYKKLQTGFSTYAKAPADTALIRLGQGWRARPDYAPASAKSYGGQESYDGHGNSLFCEFKRVD